MTAPVGGAVEAAALAARFQAALVKLGIQAIIAALALWRRVPATGRSDNDWLNASVRSVMAQRRQSRDLAVAFYRLNRALLTGRTIPDPRNPTPATVRLGSLRSEFDRLARLAEQGPETAPNGLTAPTPSTGTPHHNDDAQIRVERIPGVSDSGDTEEQAIEKEAEQEARTVLEALGPNTLDKYLEGVNTSQPAKTVDAKRTEAHDKAGSRQAAAFERLVVNGARSATWSLAERDGAVIAWARVSTTGTPCGWCAMLISRGPVYKSDKTAEFDSEGDLYHDNCHCIAVPVYSKAQYDKDPMFDMNREFGQLWPDVTKGLSGKAALSAWRRYIRQRQTTERPAQEA